METQDLMRIRRLANQALVDVFNSLGGIRWSNRSGWLTPGTEVKTWHGLTVDAGKLISLNLISNDLEGTIPSSISNLVTLKELNLAYNFGIVGEMPKEYGSMSSLTVLHLYCAGIQGHIPESLSQLGSLEELWLNGNRLSGRIPEELGRLPHLKELYLNGNELVGRIPSSFSKLTRLEGLNLGWNELSGDFPPCLGNMSRLEMLILDGNRLEELPPRERGPELTAWLADKRSALHGVPRRDKEDLSKSTLKDVLTDVLPLKGGSSSVTKEGDVETDVGGGGDVALEEEEEEEKPGSAVRPSSEHISTSKGREIVTYYLESGLQPSLQEVMHDEVGPPFDLATLRDFAAAQLMEENIDFLVEVERYRVADEESLQREATDLCTRFITPGAPMEINLSGSVRISTIAAVQSLGDKEQSTESEERRVSPRRVLDEAHREIYDLIDCDAFPRFTQVVHAKMQAFSDGTHASPRSTLTMVEFVIRRIEQKRLEPAPQS